MTPRKKPLVSENTARGISLFFTMKGLDDVIKTLEGNASAKATLPNSITKLKEVAMDVQGEFQKCRNAYKTETGKEFDINEIIRDVAKKI